MWLSWKIPHCILISKLINHIEAVIQHMSSYETQVSFVWLLLQSNLNSLQLSITTGTFTPIYISAFFEFYVCLFKLPNTYISVLLLLNLFHSSDINDSIFKKVSQGHFFFFFWGVWLHCLTTITTAQTESQSTSLERWLYKWYHCMAQSKQCNANWVQCLFCCVIHPHKKIWIN